MSTYRIHCQVIEVAPRNAFRDAPRHRDLLPWADPYITKLMQVFEIHHNATRGGGWTYDNPLSDECCSPSAFDDGWRHDAFIPRPFDKAGPRIESRHFGGFPLLDDADSGDEQVAL